MKTVNKRFSIDLYKIIFRGNGQSENIVYVGGKCDIGRNLGEVIFYTKWQLKFYIFYIIL